jgi:hypothetical protein
MGKCNNRGFSVPRGQVIRKPAVRIQSTLSGNLTRELALTRQARDKVRPGWKSNP